MSTSTNNAKVHAQMKAIIAGLPKVPATVTSVAVLGTTYTITALEAKLGGYEETYDAEDQAAVNHHMAQDAVAKIAVEATGFVAATKAALKAALGRKSAALEPVGITPDKTPAPLTTEQSAEKVAKSRATRAARHTVGPKAKAKIKGQVPPAPAQPAPVTPAPATPAATTPSH
jgi:hypothetical protein